MLVEAQEDGSILTNLFCYGCSAKYFSGQNRVQPRGWGYFPTRQTVLSKRPELDIEVLCPRFQKQKQDRDKNFTQAMNKCLHSNVIEIDIIIKAKYRSKNFFPPK